MKTFKDLSDKECLENTGLSKDDLKTEIRRLSDKIHAMIIEESPHVILASLMNLLESFVEQVCKNRKDIFLVLSKHYFKLHKESEND